MAEGLVGGILGGEEEKPEVEAPEALAGAEAFAAAVAAKLAGNDPEVARDTSAFLKKQTQLLDTQNKHLEDEHPLRLAHLGNQLREESVRRLGLRLRVGFQLFLVLVAIVIGVGIVVMLRDAFRSHSVVIDAFETPAALASRGVTGTAVASGLLDELTRLQQASRSTEQNKQKRDLANAWSNDVKIEVPETGISLGEISRLLTARFGHDIHIGGGLVQTASEDLALTVRGDSVRPKTFTGRADELDKLIVNAAQYTYAESQPSLWALYLAETGRCGELIALAKSEYPELSPADRPLFLDHWADCLSVGGSFREAMSLWQAAIRLQPSLGVAYFSEQLTLITFGEEEEAWRTGEEMRGAAGGRTGAISELYFGAWDRLTMNLPAELDALVADTQARGGSTRFGGVTRIAMAQALLHDPAAAALTLQTDNDPIPEDVATIHIAGGLAAAETGDAVRAASEMQAAEAAPATAHIYAQRADRCQIAPLEEEAGHPDRADAVIRNGEHFVDCQRFRGDILDHRGDWPGAQQAYASAVALAPDLPAGYYSWGVALARHGDLAGAQSKLKDANQRGPHWADPLKAWGDVLLKQGKTKEALAKYDEALKFAPNWRQLKEARAATANHET
jgi:tetratricopeptide (TPR) repeat protein